MVQRELRQRQKQQDALALQRESRLARSDELDMQLRRQEMNIRQQQHEDALKQHSAEQIAKVEEQKHNDVVKNIGMMPKGYVPSAADVADAAKYHVPLDTEPSTTASVPTGQTNVQLPGATRIAPPAGVEGPTVEAPASEALPTASAASPQALRIQGAYKGNVKQQADDEHKREIDRFLVDLPNQFPGLSAQDQQRVGAEMRFREITGGGSIPAGVFEKPAQQTSEAVFQQNPRTGTVQRLVDGQWVDWKGDVPKGAHFMSVPAPPTESGHYQLQPEVDPKTGQQTGKFFSFDTRGNKLGPVSVPTEGPAATKAAPGATQIASKEYAKADARTTLEHLDNDIDVAERHGLLGPSAGRIADVERWIGSSDPAANTLAARMIAAKMQVDAGIGGMRAAASPQLLARWDSIMSAKMTKDNLHAAVKVLRELVASPNETPAQSTAPTSPAGSDFIDLGGGIKYRKK